MDPIYKQEGKSIQKEAEVQEKEREVEEWKNAYEELQIRYSDLLDQMKAKTWDCSSRSGIRPEILNHLVEEMMEDPDINLKKIPDWLEKPIRYNMLWMTLYVLEKVFRSFQLDLLGHQVRLHLVPKETEDSKDIPEADIP